MSPVLASPVILYAAHLTMGSAAATLLVARPRTVRQLMDQVVSRAADGTSGAERHRLLLTGAAAAGLAFLVATMFELPTWSGMATALVAFVATPIYLRRQRRRKYVESFDKTLVESLMTVASSLKAGLTLKDALLVAADNCPAPFSTEVQRALKEYRFGMPLEEALEALRERIGTVDAKIAFGAIIIGNQLGGRLPEILGKIVRTVRERERVEGRLKSLTAQGRAQAVILCLAPPALGVGMALYDPVKMSLLTHTLVGQLLLALAVVLELIGIFVMSRMLRLEV